MPRYLPLLVVALLALVHSTHGDEIRPVPFRDVTVTDSFWSKRLEANRAVTVRHVLDECERTGRIANFVAAGKALADHAPQPGGMHGYFFNDSDVYKAIEGAAVLLATKPDPELEARCDAIIALIAKAQEPDGYLYTSRTIMDPANLPPGGPERWSDMGGGHELYCAGHLYEAAVAYAAATGKTALLDIARRNADLVAKVFGPQGNPRPCGHPEVEIGLAKLFESTHDQRYLDLLRFFIDTRGRADRGRGLYGEYAQDHAPVLEQGEAVGHAVRLAYLQSGLLELARLDQDDRYRQASERIWQDIVARKLYLTGGIGSQGNNEGFGAPYELANGSAYNETCAAIAFVLWNERLFLATGDARYVDVLERTLHNGALAGVGLGGDRFFYPNPLEASSGRQRTPWFDCACCPPNVVRFLASMPGLIYATGERELYVNLYVASDAKATVAGVPVAIRQTGDMPYGGEVRLAIEPERPVDFALRLRLPGWARGEIVPGGLYRTLGEAAAPIAITLNGAPVDYRTEHGYAVIDRRWTKGDRVDLVLPLQVLEVVADDRVAADRGRVALERGPLVYCLEQVDQAGRSPLGAVVDTTKEWTLGDPMPELGGARPLRGSVRGAERTVDGKVKTGEPAPAVAIPYCLWANRGPGAMAVWLASDPAAAKPAPAPTIARRAKASSSFGGDLNALSDQLDPSSSGDHEHPFLHWWPRKGTEEWVAYDFDHPIEVGGVEVYWFDDTGRGECRLPQSWRLEAKVDGTWKPVANPSDYGVEGDRYVRCTFDPLVAEGLRIVVQARPQWAGGIHEWRVLGNDDGPSPTGCSTLPNGSFEARQGGDPQGWGRSTWNVAAGDPEPRFLSAAPGRHGNAVGLASVRGADMAWSQTVAVPPWSRCRLSGWIRSEELHPIGGASGALLNLHGLDVRTPAVTGSTPWTRVEVEFESGDNDAVMVNCLFGGWGLATGRAWFDDIALDVLSTKPAPAPRITIDASRIGEPISPFIYGQFIEHLGRCIQGGIWAEMLADRKFFLPVGEGESPWKPLAGATVAMDAREPFVGTHSPRIAAGKDGAAVGLSQGDLAVRAGSSYVGSVWLAADEGCGPIEILLGKPGDRNAARYTIAEATRAFSRYEFLLRPTADSDDATFAISSNGPAGFRVGAASLMPGDNVRGFRADTLALLKELDATVYRWPGGNFVSGYDWHDGVGERDRRPPRKNPAWRGVEPNDVGLHEFLDLCELLEAEPYIAVNAGLGDAASAAEEVQYVNGPADSPAGRRRAANGHPEPWHVLFWGIGNEMYGSWQLGNVPLAEYTKRHRAFADAMRASDPSIQLVGVGAVGDWSRTMLDTCADRLDLLSEHVYWQSRPSLLSHVRQAPQSLATIAREHRRYRRELPSLAGRDIRLVQDEWNYWYGPEVFGELGTRYFMKDALGCAAALHEFGRNSDLFFMANYAQTVNVIGAIKTSRTNAALESTGLVLKLYRHRFGTLPCATETTPTIDALAAWTPDRRTLTIAIVNPSTSPQEIALDLRGATLAGTGTRWEIAHPDPLAFNDPDGERPIAIVESKVESLGTSLRVAPCSVTLYALPAAESAR